MGMSCFRGFGVKATPPDEVMEWKPPAKEAISARKTGVKYSDWLAYKRGMQFQSDEAVKTLKKLNLTPAQARQKVLDARVQVAKIPTSKSRFWDKDAKAWYPARADLHNKILEDMFRKVKSSKSPRCLMTGGIPASGKGTMLKANAYRHMPDSVELNSDIFKEILAKADGRKGLGVYANAYHDESKELLTRAIQRAVIESKPIILDVTMKTSSSIEATLIKLKNSGYLVEGAFAELPMEKCIERSFFRYFGKTGRFVDPAVVAENDLAPKNTFIGLKKQFTSWKHWDTNVPAGQPAKLIAQSKRQSIFHKSGGKVEEFIEVVEDESVPRVRIKAKPYAELWAVGPDYDDEEALLASVNFDDNCYRCIHYKGNNKCEAFDNIPSPFIMGLELHTNVVGKQNGEFVYEKK